MRRSPSRARCRSRRPSQRSVPAPTAERELTVQPGKAVIPFAIRNGGDSTYRHPDPVEPTPVVVRWRDAAGERSFVVRTLLPLALAAGEEILRPVETSVPAPPGRYEVTLELEEPDRIVLARRTVDVAAPE